MTTVINLYGGPGTGKSTCAAYLFYLLKSQDREAELVREYVKDWAWEDRRISTYDQFYLMGKQIRRESMLYGRVDWVVTDSPVLLQVYYAQAFTPRVTSEGIRAAVLAYYEAAAKDGHTHVHVMLRRTKAYQAKGRYQTEEQARAIDGKVQTLLDDLGFMSHACDTDEPSLDTLLGSLVR